VTEDTTDTPQLEGSWAAVSGGSRGIGRAIAMALAHEGVNVTILYLEHHGAADEVVEGIAAVGVEGEKIGCDVREAEHVNRTLGARPYDILVNCAGINADRTVTKLTLDDWQDVLATNLTGTFLCSRAVVPAMRERGYGRIVNVASIIGQTGNFGQANYAASKAGVIGFTKSLALETARANITVNAVCPGFIETDMLRSVPSPIAEDIKARIPIGRFGRPEEVADAVMYLVRPAARYITGQQINVNGGMYL
jgi:acetoacetyl-CoA reductase